MNTDKMIPIDFCRNITPFVAGDVYFDKHLGVEVAMSSQVADAFNEGNFLGDDGRYFVLSFADRPNTGKRPVGDDVMVDMEYYYNHKDFGVSHWYAGQITWQDQTTYKSWKPNHAAMLAKFKQGANTMFTFENTKEATHLRWSKCHKMFCFYLSDGFNIWQGGNGFVGHYHKDCDNESIELSRPAGERKEDHTIDGVVTYALTPVRQYDDQEAELATHFSGNNNRFYIKGHTMIRKAMVLNDDGRWIYSDCTTNAELNGDEFWKLDADQDKPPYHIELAIGAGAINDVVISPDEPVIEPWVGDQFVTLDPLKAGDVIGCRTNPINGSIESLTIGREHYTMVNDKWVKDKPVFTQEMSDAGELPPIGVKCEIKLRNNKQSSWEIGSIEVKKGEWVCIDRCESLGVYDLADLYFRPIDNRTDKQKLIGALADEFDGWTFEEFSNYNYAKMLLESDKFTITLNKE